MSANTSTFRLDRAFAQELDSRDPLAAFRDKFHIPKMADGRDHIYMCGNSLGLQPKSVRAFVEQELADWEKLGVEGHIHARNPWLPYHEFLTNSMSKVVGGQENEVVVMNSLTVNLHLLMVSFYRPTQTRHKIIIEADAFPSDRYAVISQIQFHGFDPKTSLIELRSKSGHPVIPTEEILEVIAREGDSVALVMLGGVNYYSGQAFEMQKITEAGHAVGAKIGFDLAHGAGNLRLKLHEWGPDFACWCGYKYLNSGPGGLSGIFIHNRHATDFSIRALPDGGATTKPTALRCRPTSNRCPVPKAGNSAIRRFWHWRPYAPPSKFLKKPAWTLCVPNPNCSRVILNGSSSKKIRMPISVSSRRAILHNGAVS